MIGNRIGSTCQLALSTCVMMMMMVVVMKFFSSTETNYSFQRFLWPLPLCCLNHSFHKAQLLPAIKWYESHLLYWSFSDIFWYCRMPFYDHFSSQPAKYVFVIKQRKCGFRSYVSFVLTKYIEGSLSASDTKKFKFKI